MHDIVNQTKPSPGSVSCTPMAPRKHTSAPAAPDAQAGGEGPSTSGKDAPSNVVYLGHIPHGFYEKQIKQYFTQFGKVTKVRVSRNKKTGASKHYAFLEFQSPEVARVAADAMDGYMMFGQKVTTRVMPRAEVHADLFKGANRVFKAVPWRRIEVERHNKELEPAQEAARTRGAARRDRQRQQRIKEAGIDYEYAGVATKRLSKPTKMRFDDEDA